MLLRTAHLERGAAPRAVARALLSTSATTSSAASTAPPRLASLPSRSVLEVSGPDAQKFLRGQMCKDVEPLAGGYSGFLNASGRILHSVFSVPTKPGTYLIAHERTSPELATPLHTLLPPFRLRSKVRFKDVTSEWDVWAAWGHDEGVASGPAPSATWRFGSGGAAERLWSWEGGAGGVAPLGVSATEAGCWDLRAGWGAEGMGRKLFVPKGEKPSLAASHDVVDTDEYTLHRMLLGVPEGPNEIIPGSALPLESDMDIHGGVDFRKGCYLGQELTVRTYHTGATRKRILPVSLFPLDSSSPPPPLSSPADLVFTPPTSAASKKARSAGKLLALHGSGAGLALVRLEWADRVWPDAARERFATTGEWGAEGTLTAELGGERFGVYVGHGEAYAAALAALPPPPPPEE